MLVPVELAQRAQGAPLIVEARVRGQQTERLAGHLVTRSQLDVFKIFKGRLPGGPLSILTAGGALGLEREVASSTLQLQAGQQGVFFLETDPTAPGEWRAYAGPQGLIAYDLTDLAATEPFGSYASIEADLYPALTGQVGAAYRVVQPNDELTAARARPARPAATQRTLAVPTIDSFSPTTITAGTSTSTDNPTATLTINGAGFNSTQGTGFVEFRNADNPGAGTPNYVQPLATDYVSWSDTQIQVRVPSYSTTRNAAGTGLVRVTNSDGNLATSASALTVTYALITTAYPTDASGLPTASSNTYRIHLVGTDGAGGYTLQYASSFLADAKTPFETALQSWRCATQMNRSFSATTATQDITQRDGVNVVRFAGSSELPTGVLGVTYSYYNGCIYDDGEVDFYLTETDYVYPPLPYPGYTWNFTTSAPTGTQFDFQSVAVHELGHGEQLTHIISTPGVMNYSVSNGVSKRTLDNATDITGGNDVINYSTNVTQLCNQATFTTLSCPQPLPVELTAFSATYVPGQGTRLHWATASEHNTAAFVVESQETASTTSWQDLTRVAAAGTSASAHQYNATDPRLLSGTRYYRLRQLDLDGTVAYSPVVAVRTAEATTITAAPNPATGSVTLRGPLAAGATTQVRLLDATGRCVAQRTGPAGQASLDLSLAGVRVGLYLVEWTAGEVRCHTRLAVE